MNCNQCGELPKVQIAKSHLLKEKLHELSPHLHDPLAKQSRVMHSQISGDGDVWVEKVFRNTKNGKLRNYFVSTNTGKKVRFEPPTGASQVVYLKDEVFTRCERSRKLV